MTTVMEHLSAFWLSYGSWIGVALIPTIISGLTISPKTADGAPIVQKVWDMIKMVMSVLSILTHKDQPGTFQAPLKMGRLVKKAPPTTLAAVVLLFAFSSSQVNCAWWDKHGQQVEDVAINCGTTAIHDAAMHLLPAVLAIVSGGSINWNEQLNAFAKQFGQDSVACALEFASNKLMAEAPMGVGYGSSESMEGVNRARSYMVSHHMKVQE
jgi:hypothetical protein